MFSRARETQDPKKEERRQRIEAAEKKLGALLDLRDKANLEAKLIANERDALNSKRREMVEALKERSAKRSGLVGEARKRKEARNALQDQAKRLIAIKRGMRKGSKDSQVLGLEDLERRIQVLEKNQETTVMSVADENEMIEEIRDLLRKHREMVKRAEEAFGKQVEISKIDSEIDALFKRAEEEHAKVVELAKQIEAVVNEADDLVLAIGKTAAEANKRHEKFLKARERANEAHEKARDLRDEVMKIKGEGREEAKAAREEMKQQKEELRQRFVEKAKEKGAASEDEALDKALEKLKQKGTIRIG
jgi:uncharacterized coiled-coil DUF342 family protein